MANPYGMTLGGLLDRDLIQPVKRFATNNPLDAAAIATMPVPIVGDIAGVLADANMYATRPEERTFLNAGMSLAGLLPFVPIAFAIQQAKKNAGDPRSLRNPATISEQNIGYGGDISTTKTKPIDEMSYTFEETPGGLLAPQKMTPEQMFGSGRNVQLPLVGDRTRAGGVVTKIDGKDVNVSAQGGYQFGQSRAQMDDQSVWASEGSIPKTIQNTIDEAGREADEVFLTYSAMGARSDAVSHHMADSLMDQVKVSKISKKSKKVFDEDYRKLVPDWPGIDSPKAQEFLDSTTQGKRGAFSNLMSAKKYTDMGFPDIATTRLAITDPKLLFAPTGESGQFIGRGRPGAEIDENPSYIHKTYDKTIKGDYVGELEQTVPRQIMFPEFYRQRRAADAPVGADDRSFGMGSPTVQKLDQEWLDGVMKYYDDLSAGRYD